ncbi:MAG TPA: hypothetical protein VFA41_00120 [Ktedonobacteraceae bacterium]|jgi:hypothetical protein|nr:hypothetical protein [Ktedonobacteraceae bacterium]
MSSRLSQEDTDRLVPILGSVARLIVSGSRLDDSELRVLLLGAGLDDQPTFLNELKLWIRLLKAVHEQPGIELRRATVEALMLRNLSEASVLLAVDAVTSSVASEVNFSSSAQEKRLQVQPSNVDFGHILPGQIAIREFEVQGGPGQIVVESDQLLVTPLQFGSGTTQVKIQTKPMQTGLLWTSLRFVTSTETVEVPVLAQWLDAPSTTVDVVTTPTSEPASQSNQDVDFADMIQQALFSATNSPSSGGTAGGANRNTQPNSANNRVGNADQEILDQLRRLLG